MAAHFQVVGTSPPRVDGRAKVTGQAQFGVDVRVHGMAYGRVLRSPYPHARIVGIDTSAARAHPGVYAIVTGSEVSQLPAPYYGHVIKDRSPLAIDRVRFVGEPVAVVVADSPLTAEDAEELVQIQYEELPAVLSVTEAQAPGAPELHPVTRGAGDYGDLVLSDPAPNRCFVQTDEHGDVDAAFAVPAHLFADTFRFPSVFQCALEPFTATAQWLADGTLQVWSASQHPFVVRAELAGMFGLGLSQVRLSTPYLGGGFGSKAYTVIEPLAALAALYAKRPVQVTLSLEESFQTTRRHSADITIETAVTADGRILGRKAVILLDTGAYADNGPRVAVRAGHRLLGAYVTPAYRIESRAIYTNNIPAGSFRAIGGAQAVWAGESQMDMIAERMGLDPIAFRLLNLAQRGQPPMPGLKPLDTDLSANLRRLVSMASEGSAQPLGVALGVAGAGAGPVTTALVRLHADGNITIHAASAEMGQGAQTVLPMICAETLGADLQRVRMLLADTQNATWDRGTGSSRATTVVGTAVASAAEDLRRQLVDVAADLLKVDRFDLKVSAGQVVTTEGRKASFEQLVQHFYGMRGGEMMGLGYSGPRVPGSKIASDPVFWETSIGAAQLDLDYDTGEIRVNHYFSLSDVGCAIHPGLAHGQELGAIAQGLGHTLFEETQVQAGQLLNSNLVDYRLPLATDIPEVTGVLIENGDGPGPFGCKGMGEGAIMPVAPAVANALWRTAGIRITELPLTPERVWRALQAAGANETGRRENKSQQ